MPKAEEIKQKPEPNWNTLKPGGWEKYKEVSEKMTKIISYMTEDTGIKDEHLMNKVDKIQDKMKFTVFGKTTHQAEKAKRKEKEVAGSESEDAKDLLRRRQTKRITKAVESGRNTPPPPPPPPREIES